MGKLITFWSPVRGTAKVTSALCAIVSALGLHDPKVEIAIAHAKEGNTDLEDRMDVKIVLGRKKDFYERTGLAALILNYKQGELNAERIKRCAVPLLLGNVSLFPGAGTEFSLIQGGDFPELEFHILTDKLVKEFELTCLDLENGMSEVSFRYMQAADLVVVVLPQIPLVWERCFKLVRERLKGKPVFFVFSGYVKDSRYGVSQLRRKVRDMERKIGRVPWNVGFMDALAEGRTMEFFLKNQMVGKKEENYEFMEQTGKTAEQIRRMVTETEGALFL